MNFSIISFNWEVEKLKNYIRTRRVWLIGSGFILKTTRAKSSRQLWLKTENGEINTNLRIRITLNNGVNALLGKSKSNKSSTPSIKIQQDNVDKFIESCLDKTTYLY